MRILTRTSLALLVVLTASRLAAEPLRDPQTCAAWLWKEGDGAFRLFRCTFESDGSPATIGVSADMRYVLKLDGRRIGRGPDRGTVERWTWRRYELPLTPGRHVLEAVVRHGGTPPLAQTTWRPGFILSAEGRYDALLTTGKGAWSVAMVGDVRFGGETGGAFGLGLPEIVKGDAPEFAEPDPSSFSAPDIVRSPVPPNGYCHAKPGWKMSETTLPEQLDRAFTPTNFAPFTVSANSSAERTFGLGGYVCAYPELIVSGGRGATLSLSWAESEGRLEKAFTDTFVPTGGTNRFSLSWFRAGRYCRLSVRTGDEPLKVEDFVCHETRYPIPVTGAFACDDPTLVRVAGICRRTIEVCSHETTFDCPYYEQLQYLGDSRIQFLAQVALTADDRLAKRAIELFESSQRTDGLMPMNCPVGGPASESTTYTMFYPLLLNDYVRWRGDRDWARRRLPALAHLMEGLASHANEEGLLEGLPGWNFIDWTDWGWRDPDFGDEPSGTGLSAGQLSAIENLLYVCALQSAASVEDAVGAPALARLYRERADRVRQAVVARFWDESRGLLADDPQHRQFSEHAAALAILSEALSGDKLARCIRALLDDRTLVRASVYFSCYVFSAYFRSGHAESFLKRLDLWRSYARDGYETTLESPAPSRSECHGWGAHPLYHFTAGLAGVTPDAPFFGRVRIAPQPGGLKRISSRVPHPKGNIDVDLSFSGERVGGRVRLPDGVDGVFVWHGRERPIKGEVEINE